MNINLDKMTLDAINNEDIGVVEGMQRGRQSSAFSGGVFPPIMDKPSQHFAKWVAKQLTRSEN